MGGGFYSQDIAYEARSSGHQGFAFGGSRENGKQKLHPALDPMGHIRECMNETALVVALDVTRSRGDDTKLMYAKLPEFIGQIQVQGYVQGVAISFCAIGDAASGDRAPLQVGQFEADNRLDKVLENFWIEEGGGGTGQESYELAAYYYARHSILECLKKGKKGYFFFVGDEGFYPVVRKDLIRSVCGFEVTADIAAAEIFTELQKKYHTYLIYPQKDWQDRLGDISAEIRQRVESAGGQYKNVDIRASLIWDNRNDLDLHVICPSGEEIYYRNKQSACGGWLDVDMNVQGESTKPVENVRWAHGTAPAGHYRIFVQNYRFHEKVEPARFTLELEVNGKKEYFDRSISLKGETGHASDITIAEFDYNPAERKASPQEEAALRNYDDRLIKDQWASVLGTRSILLIEDPAAITDVILGVLAIQENKTTLAGYTATLRGLGRSQHEIAQVEQALTAFA